MRPQEGRPDDPGGSGNPLPQGGLLGGDAPTAPTHSSRRRAHAPRAELERPGRRERAESQEPRLARADRLLKTPPEGVACLRPAPPRPADSRTRSRGLGRQAGGLLVADSGLRTKRQKAGVPPLPAASRPPGIFPRPGTAPADPAPPFLPTGSAVSRSH